MNNLSAVREEYLREWGRVELADFLTNNVRGFQYVLYDNIWRIKYGKREYSRKDIKSLLYDIFKKAVKEKNLSPDIEEQIRPHSKSF